VDARSSDGDWGIDADSGIAERSATPGPHPMSHEESMGSMPNLENFALLGFLRLNPEDGLADFVVLREPGQLERRRGFEGDRTLPATAAAAASSPTPFWSRSTSRWPATPGSSSSPTSSRPRPSPCT